MVEAVNIGPIMMMHIVPSLSSLYVSCTRTQVPSTQMPHGTWPSLSWPFLEGCLKTWKPAKLLLLSPSPILSTTLAMYLRFPYYSWLQPINLKDTIVG